MKQLLNSVFRRNGNPYAIAIRNEAARLIREVRAEKHDGRYSRHLALIDAAIVAAEKREKQTNQFDYAFYDDISCRLWRVA